MAKGKIQLKLQVNTSFKGQILLWQSIKITLVVKLMFMGMVDRHVKPGFHLDFLCPSLLVLVFSCPFWFFQL